MTMHSGTNAPSASTAAAGYEDGFSLASDMYSIQRNGASYILYHNLGGSIVSTTLGGGAESDTLQTVTDRGATTTNSITVGANLDVGSSIRHDGDTNTSLDFSTDTIALKTAGAQRFFVESDGQVGIGTMSVSNQLTIYGNASVGTSYYNQSAPANSLIVESKVGIGTTQPTHELDVNGAVRIKNYAFSALPAASTAGLRAFIYDSYYTFSSSVVGSTAYGGGSNFAPVYSDGSQWRYG